MFKPEKTQFKPTQNLRFVWVSSGFGLGLVWVWCAFNHKKG
jgi:hypothetical protein